MPSLSFILTLHFTWDELQQFTRLAVKCAAERVERGEADRAGFVGLEDGKIGQGDANALGQFGETELTFLHHAVEIELDHGRLAQIVSAFSSLSASPCRNTSDSASTSRPEKNNGLPNGKPSALRNISRCGAGKWTGVPDIVITACCAR